jgi:hypothetical protein
MVATEPALADRMRPPRGLAVEDRSQLHKDLPSAAALVANTVNILMVRSVR